MEKIADYIVLEKLRDTKNSSTFRVKKEKNSDTYILKLFNRKNSSPSDIARFKQEYNKLKSKDIESIVQVIDFIDGDEDD